MVWIEYGFTKAQNHPNLIYKCFCKSGITEDLYDAFYEIEEEIPKGSEISLEFTDMSKGIQKVIHRREQF